MATHVGGAHAHTRLPSGGARRRRSPSHLVGARRARQLARSLVVLDQRPRRARRVCRALDLRGRRL